MTAAERAVLVERHLPMVRHAVAPFVRLFPATARDLFQEGTLALMDALDGYDPARARLSSYAYPAIRRRAVLYLKRTLSPTSVPGGGSGRRVPLLDLPRPARVTAQLLQEAPGADELVAREEDRERVRRALRALTAAERTVVELRLMADGPERATLDQVAAVLFRRGLAPRVFSREGARQIELRTIRRLREVLR